MQYAKQRNIPIVKLPQYQAVLYIAVHHLSPVIVIGDTSVAKTAGAKQLLEQYDFEVLSYNLAHTEATELTGPMFPMKNGKQSRYMPDNRIPFKGMDDEKEDDRFGLFLDEPNRGNEDAVNAAMPAFDEHRLGPHELGDNVYVFGAMNPPTDEFNIQTRINADSAIRRRICQVALEFDEQIFQQYIRDPGQQKKIDLPDITLDHEWMDAVEDEPWSQVLQDFLKANWNDMYDKKKGTEKLFPNPGSWEAVNKTIKVMDRYNFWKFDKLENAFEYKIGGHIGTSAASKFVQFMDKQRNTIDAKEVLRKYKDTSSDVHSKVQSLMQSQDNNRLAMLTDNLAFRIYEIPDDELENVAESVGQFLIDVRPQFAEDFMSGLEEYGTQGATNNWTDELDFVYTTLARNEQWRNYMTKHANLTTKMEKKAKQAVQANG